jgi:hypothetical protein
MTRSRTDKVKTRVWTTAVNRRRRAQSHMGRAMNSMLGLACLYAAFDIAIILALPSVYDWLTRSPL